jgi:hypothetical protein
MELCGKNILPSGAPQGAGFGAGSASELAAEPLADKVPIAFWAMAGKPAIAKRVHNNMVSRIRFLTRFSFFFLNFGKI